MKYPHKLGWSNIPANSAVHERELLEQRVCELISKVVGVNIGDVEMSSTPDELEPDSLDAIEILMAFEEELEIEIPDDTAERWKTVGDAVNTIERLLAEK